jgi:hypothetical protein
MLYGKMSAYHAIWHNLEVRPHLTVGRKLMNRPTLLTLVLAVLLLSACRSVELIDHTPEEFPAVEYPPLELPPQVFQELAELGGYDEHRFRVEVKSQFFVDRSSIRALVWLDGSWHNMSGEGNGIWYYDWPNKCNKEYNYTFEVTHSKWSN